MTTVADLWPPFGLHVLCGPLSMAAVTDDDIPPLVDLALAGVHDADVMPFVSPWTDAPADELPAAMARYYWMQRSSFSPATWNLDLVVRHGGEVVGVQGLAARDYLVVRTGETGSWLGRRFQGHGIGTLMRQVMCALAFDHLDAAEITSAAFVDNPASAAVSRKVGYVEDGTTRVQRRPGELAQLRRLVLTHDRFVRAPVPVEVDGVESLRRAIGLPDAEPD